MTTDDDGRPSDSEAPQLPTGWHSSMEEALREAFPWMIPVRQPTRWERFKKVFLKYWRS